MIRRPPRSTQSRSSAASDVYKRQLLGHEPVKRDAAKAGDTVAFGRLESVKTGDTLSTEKGADLRIAPAEIPEPVFGLAIEAKEKKDDVKLTAALARIIEEDASLSITQDQDMGQMVPWGQGEMHLRVALERLTRKYGVNAATHPRAIPYKETIRKTTEVRGRHKKQSGGHAPPSFCGSSPCR